MHDPFITALQSDADQPPSGCGVYKYTNTPGSFVKVGSLRYGKNCAITTKTTGHFALEW